MRVQFHEIPSNKYRWFLQNKVCCSSIEEVVDWDIIVFIPRALLPAIVQVHLNFDEIILIFSIFYYPLCQLNLTPLDVSCLTPLHVSC